VSIRSEEGQPVRRLESTASVRLGKEYHGETKTEGPVQAASARRPKKRGKIQNPRFRVEGEGENSVDRKLRTRTWKAIKATPS